MRLILIFIVVAVLVTIPFLLMGESFGVALSGEEAEKHFRKQYGDWAWLAALGLLAADLVLPIPATAVISTMGIIYGSILGGLIGATGSVIAGLIAYGLSRSIGRPAAVWLAGEKDLARGERFFANAGGWAVALSRWMPILPEAIACLAGMARMPFARFFTALLCGSVPMAFAYAILGATNANRPALALLLSAVVPAVLWLIVGRILKSFETPEEEA